MDINSTAIKLYESNSDAVYIQANDGETWDMGNEPADRRGSFSTDASMWVDGDWAPSGSNGQTLCDSDAGLTLVATWTAADEVQLETDADHIGGTARAYLGLDD